MLSFTSKFVTQNVYNTYSKTLFRHSSSSNKRGLVLGVYESEDGKAELTPAAQSINQKSKGRLLEQINLGGKISAGKARLFWGFDGHPIVAVAGLGKRVNDSPLENVDEVRERVRKAAGSGCNMLKSISVHDILVESMCEADAAAEGATLASYIFQKNKLKKKQETKVTLYDEDDANVKLWNEGVVLADAQNWARYLMECPANQMTPTIFCKEVSSLLSQLGVNVECHDKDWAAEKKMNSFLSVSNGSAEPPMFLEVTYTGNGDEKPVVLVGKGITFDTGGISIKPSDKMDEMRGDMGGAACVVATVSALAAMQIPVNVKVLVPLCENMPGGRATKPGDVVVAMNGKSIAVDNTDAEGRLVLADALCYAAEFTPRFVLDMATLTGAIRVALGGCATGVFATDDELWAALNQAAYVTGDRVWRMPLFKHYATRMTQYKGYDVNNMGLGTDGGSCKAAGFLAEFRPADCPWLHLDIAGVMNESADHSYLASGMTGRPTRTVVEFIKMLAKDTSTPC